MSFLTPFFLLLALLAVPIIIMYMLRLRRQEIVVSSTFLWEKLVRDREANAPWQRLRRNILLILQLIILALLVFALARPFLRLPSVVNRSVVVLLDGSPSMQATDTAEGGFPIRFDAAKAEVNRLIRSLSGGNQMTIIQVGPVPTVLTAPTSDKRQLYDAVEQAVPNSATADWQAAFALASGAAQGFR
ncbi:MAG: BatA and WFA domain-containing protein, partial [Chloroflexota bacterium]